MNLPGKGGIIYQICLEKVGKVFNLIWKKVGNFNGSVRKRCEKFSTPSGKKAGNFNESARKRWENFPNLSGKGRKFYQICQEKVE
jgi:hypothetical protein